MKISGKAFLLVFVFVVAASIMISNSYGYSLLTGITVLEESKGVVIYEIRPDTPLKNAGIKKGDIIIQIDEQKIKSISDYVNYSRTLRNNKHEILIRIKRNTKILDFSLDEYSAPIKQYWGEKVLYSKDKIPKSKEPFNYWIDQGKRNLNSIKDDTPYQQKMVIYQKAIDNIYNAVHYNPKMTSAIILVADIYKKIGETSITNGLKGKAIENFKISIRLYKKVMAKNIQKKNLIEIRDNLRSIEDILKQKLG